MKEVQITSGFGTLCGTMFSDSDSLKKPGVLLLHGWMSAQDRMYEIAGLLATEMGAVCLTVDLRGHGKTGGDLEPLSRKDFLDDVLVAYDYLASQENVDATRMGVIGSSFGGHLAALLTARRGLSWAVLHVPADYPDASFADSKVLAPDNMGWRQEVRVWSTTDALRSLHSFGGKVLIVESEKDEVIPRQTLLNYQNATQGNSSYVIMKNAPHSITRYPDFKRELNHIVSEWLTSEVYPEKG